MTKESKSFISRSANALPVIDTQAKDKTLVLEEEISRLTAFIYLVPISKPIIVLAFFEKSDVKMLKKLASEGWIFNGFAFGGYFYKFVEGPKQQLTYNLDIQFSPDEEYFDIIKSGGWEHIASQSCFHVFAAPVGTTPMYSNNEFEEGKYQEFTKQAGKTAIFSLLFFVLFCVFEVVSLKNFEIAYYPFKILKILSFFGFVFSVMGIYFIVPTPVFLKINRHDNGRTSKSIRCFFDKAWLR